MTSEAIAQLAIARRQLELQVLHIRGAENGPCRCACWKGRRDNMRSDHTCDLCLPYVTGFHRARTELDRALDKHFRSMNFDPASKADEFVERKLDEGRRIGQQIKDMYAIK